VPLAPPEIVKAYDIRGLYGEQMNGDADRGFFIDDIDVDDTEPLLRLNLESPVSPADLERRRDEVLELIRS
jgi:hypothetical protein